MESQIIWINEILPNWENNSHKNKKIEYARKGIPHSIRVNVWTKSCGNLMGITKKLYENFKKKAQIIQNQIKIKEENDKNKKFKHAIGCPV